MIWLTLLLQTAAFYYVSQPARHDLLDLVHNLKPSHRNVTMERLPLPSLKLTTYPQASLAAGHDDFSVSTIIFEGKPTTLSRMPSTSISTPPPAPCHCEPCLTTLRDHTFNLSPRLDLFALSIPVDRLRTTIRHLAHQIIDSSKSTLESSHRRLRDYFTHALWPDIRTVVAESPIQPFIMFILTWSAVVRLLPYPSNKTIDVLELMHSHIIVMQDSLFYGGKLRAWNPLALLYRYLKRTFISFLSRRHHHPRLHSRPAGSDKTVLHHHNATPSRSDMSRASLPSRRRVSHIRLRPLVQHRDTLTHDGSSGTIRPRPPKPSTIRHIREHRVGLHHRRPILLTANGRYVLWEMKCNKTRATEAWTVVEEGSWESAEDDAGKGGTGEPIPNRKNDKAN